MGGVFISPNLKKTSDRIDTSGNIIDKNSKQIISANTPEYVPTPEEIQKTTPVTEKPVDSMSEKINKMVEAKLASKIDEIVDKKVADILSKL